jgi:hypothetical protein
MKNTTKIFLICLVIFLLFLFYMIKSADAMVFGQCVSECQSDVMYISDCMDDEQGYWDLYISSRDLRRSCIDLIRNERIQCYSMCAKKEAEANSAAFIYEFYEAEIQSFPNSQSY